MSGDGTPISEATSRLCKSCTVVIGSSFNATMISSDCTRAWAAGLFFSTDTTAAQRALEIKAEAILKGTKVDGVYDADPNREPGAHRFESIDYTEFLTRGLQVMDATAISLCRENGLPIVVFNFRTAGNIKRVLLGETVGTVVNAGVPA